MSSSCEILEQSTVKAFKSHFLENTTQTFLMWMWSSFALEHASIYWTFIKHLIEQWLVIRSHDYTHEILSLTDKSNFKWIFTLYFTDYMKLYDFEGIFMVEISQLCPVSWSMLSPVSFQRSVSSRLTSISIASIPAPQPFLSGVWHKLENVFEKSH